MSQNSCAEFVKVFMAVALCEVGCRMIRQVICRNALVSRTLSFWLLSWLTKQSEKGRFPFNLISLVGCRRSVRVGGCKKRQFRLSEPR